METSYSLWIVLGGKIIAGSFLPRGIGLELSRGKSWQRTFVFSIPARVEMGGSLRKRRLAKSVGATLTREIGMKLAGAVV